MEVINTNIIYKVEVEDLTEGSYTARLWDKSSGTVESATATVPAPTTTTSTTEIATFTFSATQTGAFEEGAILTFEIFDSDQKAIYYKDRFARVRVTSLKENPSTTSTTD